MSKINNISNFKRHYQKNGFVLIKNFLKKNDCSKALKWMNAQNKKKLAKTWTEQEPGVPLAVHFVIHDGKSPIAKLANNKSVLNFASKLVEDEVYIYSSKVNNYIQNEV